MFYGLHFFSDVWSPLRLFRYISFRTGMAMATAFVLSLLLGPWLIRMLQRVRWVEKRADERVGELDRSGKVGTPSLGGLLILFSAFFATLFWANLANFYLWIAVSTFVFMGCLGFLDDVLKLRRGDGLSSRAKLVAQISWGVVLFLWLENHHEARARLHQLMVPFFKEPVWENMPLFVAFGFLVLVLTGTANSVNLTDGLDGLAIGCSTSATGVFILFSYVAGHADIATYLHIPFVNGAGELTVFCGALFGSCLGFLWFNAHPAQIFMGDTGSLSLGGALAVVAILIKQELTLLIVGGVFVMEAISVLLQIGSAKWTRRFAKEEKRLFYRAPLHHHFEHIAKANARRENRSLGAAENRIVIRFWILSLLFALAGLATLKLR